MGRLKYIALGVVLGAALGGTWIYGQPVIYPVPGTDLVTGQGSPNKIAKWTGQRTIGNGSLSDTATQANQSICFDNNGVLDCGSTLKWNPSTMTLSGFTSAVTSTLVSIVGISGTSTPANNLRGSCVFGSGMTDCTVAFPVAEATAAYFVAISCNADKAFWVTAKGTSGFTIDASAPGIGSDACDYIMVR